MIEKVLARQHLGSRLKMRSKIAVCAFAMRMLIAACVFAQDPGAKSDKASQAASVAQKPHRVRVKEDVQKAKLVHMVYAIYPPVSERRVDGTVVLRVVIGKSGAVKSARYVSGPPNLKQSAIDAVRQWRYEPTLVSGVAVEVDTTVSVVFPSPGKAGPPFGNK